MSRSLLRTSCAILPLLAAAEAAAANSKLPDDDLIIVTSSPIERTASELIAPVSVLDGEDLQRQLRATLGETLRREPGISTTAFGPGASRPIIRGLSGDRVRTLTNGLDSFDAATASPDHQTPIEPLFAQRIEVVRGSGLLRYGSSAAGGVVNVLDGRIPTEVPEDRLDAAARAAYTTVDEGTEFSGAVAYHLGKLGELDVVLNLSGATRDADDYDIPGMAESAAFQAAEEDDHDDDDHDHDDEAEGTLENSFNESDVLSAGLSFIGDKGFLGFSVQGYESSYGIPAGHDHGHHDDDHDDDDHDEEEEGGVFIDLEQTRFDVNGRLETNGFIQHIDLFAGYADYEHIEFEGPGEPGTVFSNEGVEVRVEFAQNQLGNLQGASGIQYRGREFSAIGEEAFVPLSQKDQFGIFTVQELVFGPVTLEGALRYERTEVESEDTGVDRSFDGVSVSVGGAFAATENATFTGTVFRTERAPTVEQLFSDGPHLATASFDLGDPNLDIETATGIDLGARVSAGPVRFAASVFATNYDNFIYQRATGMTGEDILMMRGVTDPEELEEFGELDAFAYTGADAQFYGFEFETVAELGSYQGMDFRADFVADYVSAELDEPDTSGSSQLPRIPPLGLIAGLEAQNDIASFRAEVEYQDSVEDTSSFELPTESFTLFNLYTDWKLTNRCTLSASVLNLTDEEARIHTSFLKDEVPLPGRNLRFAIRYDY